MNEAHTTSLALSQRLKALGIPQESEYYWVFEFKKWSIKKFKDNDGKLWAEDFPEKVFSAFLASELGEMLPEQLHGKLGKASKTGAWLSIEKRETGGWLCSYGDEGIYFLDKKGKTMSEAMGKMLEYLKKEGLLSGE